MQALAEIVLSQTRDPSPYLMKRFDAGDLWQRAPAFPKGQRKAGSFNWTEMFASVQAGAERMRRLYGCNKQECGLTVYLSVYVSQPASLPNQNRDQL